MRTTEGYGVLFLTNPGNRNPAKQPLYSHLPPILQTIKDEEDILHIAREV